MSGVGERCTALQAAAIALFSLFAVMLVLVAQKHEDELNAHRDTLTLELAILSEHKIAKVIQLLEELRRDTPEVQDRVDQQAQQMAEPADARSVLAAVRAKRRTVKGRRATEQTSELRGFVLLGLTRRALWGLHPCTSDTVTTSRSNFRSRRQSSR